MSRSRWYILNKEAKYSDREQSISNFVFLFAFPIIIGLGGAYTGEMGKLGSFTAPAFWLIVLLFYFVYWLRHRPVSRSLIGLANDGERISNELEQRDRDVSQLTQSVNLLVWQSAVSLSTRRMLIEYVRTGISGADELEESLSEILAPLYVNSEDLFGMQGSEKWNFAVYLYSAKSDSLVPVWRQRSALHPSTGVGRNWRRGEGHVGKAFVNGQAIITYDALHPDVAPLSATPLDKTNEYDKSAYRAFAAFPVGAISGEGNVPFGVLVGTSDRVGRFDKENTNILQHLADVVAGLVILAHIDVDALSEGDANGRQQVR